MQPNEYQLTKDQSIRFHDSKLWESMSDHERAMFQMQQEHLCMPMSVFQNSLAAAIGRPVFTHELALDYDTLLALLKAEGPGPDVARIIDDLNA